MIVCRTCSTEKAEDNFHIRRDTGRRRSECKACRGAARTEWMKLHPDVHQRAKKAHYERYKSTHRERSRAWNHANPEKRFDTHLRRTFGISRDDYMEMLLSQEGACAICRRPETVIDKRTGRVRRLHVDHDHETGAVRSLLCTRCNMAVGYLEDDPERAEAVATYIRFHAPGGKGTADMVRRAKAAGIRVIEVPVPRQHGR